MPTRTRGVHALSGVSVGPSRAGGRVLALFAAPLNSLILRALAERPLRLADLRQMVGGPAQTTLRAYLGGLIEIGALAKVERRGMPYTVSHELTREGRDLLFIVAVLEAWLEQAPQGEIKLGTEPAKAAIKALSEGWDTAVLQALAARPFSLTELDAIIAEISYPALVRRLTSMRMTGLVEVVPRSGSATPNVVTDWARRGIAPLAAAARWERANLSGGSEPVTWVEVEAAFLLALALITLPESADGECVLAVDTKGGERRIAGVHVIVDRGEIVSCEADLTSEPPTFALGDAEAWLEAVIAHESGRLHTSGDPQLVSALVEGIHRALFSVA